MNTERQHRYITLKQRTQRNLLITFRFKTQLTRLQVLWLSSAMHFQLHPNMAPKYLYTLNDRSSTIFSLLDLEGSGQSTLFDMVPGRETSKTYTMKNPNKHGYIIDDIL
jgi:hypothetical protein